MSLPRFFLETQVLARESQPQFRLQLAAEDAKHAAVLRLKPGEHIAVIDAESDYFECEICRFNRDDGMIVSISRHVGAPPAAPRVLLLQGLAKGEKMDMVIRHASELGVSAFLPLACSRSVVKLDAKKAAARTSRWAGIAKSAAMQSGQPRIPQVHVPCSCAEAAAHLQDMDALLVCWEEERQLSLPAAVRKLREDCGKPAEELRLALAVGPEGGFCQEEVDCLRAACPRSFAVTLGPNILRTETAGIVAPALLIYELGGLQ